LIRPRLADNPSAVPRAAQGEDTLAPYDPRRLWGGLWGRLARLSLPTRVLLGLLAFALTYRVLTLQMVASGGDSLRKWAWARVVLHGWSPSQALWAGWDHHAARLSINVPTLISQWLFGDDPSTYYVAPIAIHLLTVALIFLLARRVVGLWMAAATGLAFVCLTSVLRAGQLMPEVFSPAYVLSCVLCLTRATESVRPGPRVAWAAAAAACMMLAELSKVTNLFFVPGLLLGLGVRTRSLRLPLVFCAVLGALLLVELPPVELLLVELLRSVALRARH
jgi:hypothetical protein